MSPSRRAQVPPTLTPALAALHHARLALLAHPDLPADAERVGCPTCGGLTDTLVLASSEDGRKKGGRERGKKVGGGVVSSRAGKGRTAAAVAGRRGQRRCLVCGSIDSPSSPRSRSTPSTDDQVLPARRTRSSPSLALPVEPPPVPPPHDPPPSKKTVDPTRVESALVDPDLRHVPIDPPETPSVAPPPPPPPLPQIVQTGGGRGRRRKSGLRKVLATTV